MSGVYHPTGAFNIALNDSLVTSGGITGTNPRLRVDVGQTSFFAGREFRIFKEWSVATTATYIVKIVVPVNTILMELSMAMDEGTARLETVAGGTEGGTFSETFTNFSANNMTEKPQPPYVSQVVMTAGGTHTGGTVLDVFRLKSAGNNNFGSSVGGVGGAERGVAPGTYYFRFTLTGVIGVFKARWEERP